MKQLTTYQRAISQARKLQPAVRQIENSLIFDVASVSQLDAFHHVYLGPNRVNPLSDSKCDCSSSSKFGCIHKAAALLQLVTNLEARLWKGCDYITQAQDTGSETPEYIDEITTLWTDLLDRYERGVDLIRAIEDGQDVNTFTGRVKSGFAALTPDTSLQLLSI